MRNTNGASRIKQPGESFARAKVGAIDPIARAVAVNRPYLLHHQQEQQLPVADLGAFDHERAVFA
jgi:hypothetical protein